MKRIKFLLQLIDGLWSVPLGFFIFFGSGLFLSSVFGMAVGQYDMAFIQPLFLAGTIVLGATNIAVLGLYRVHNSIYNCNSTYCTTISCNSWVNNRLINCRSKMERETIE